MANDKYYGYSPKEETRKPSTGVTNVGTRLDRVNPYEFRKGMDVELTSLGVSRLAESTPEEREKATETVLKNLEEHGGYYSALVHYMTEFRNSDSKPNFKTFLKEFYEDTAMKEIKKDMKDEDNQMEEPKYDKSIYTLKEAIKAEVKNMLSESSSVDDATRVKDRLAKRKSMADFEKSEKEFKDLNNFCISGNSISSRGIPKDACILDNKSCSYTSPLFAPPANTICTCPSPSRSNSNILYLELLFGPDLGPYTLISGLLNKSCNIAIKVSLSILSRLPNL